MTAITTALNQRATTGVLDYYSNKNNVRKLLCLAVSDEVFEQMPMSVNLALEAVGSCIAHCADFATSFTVASWGQS